MGSINEAAKNIDFSQALMAHIQAQHKLCAPWILENLPPKRKILDIGCGHGIVAHMLAQAGHQVTGVDLSPECIDQAKDHDLTRSIRYLNANAYSLPFQDGEFDAIVAVNILEHVEEPNLLIGEAARVLKGKGSLFFQTVNRTWQSFLFKTACRPHAPSEMRLFPLYIKPEELEEMFEMHKLTIQMVQGMRPNWTKSFWKMIGWGTGANDISYRFCHSLKMGYCGIARKKGSLSLR